MKKYLITVMTATNSGDEIHRQIIEDRIEAKNYYDQQVGYLIQETVDDNNLTEEEKTEYIAEIRKDESVNDYLNSAIDPDNEWAVYLEEIEEEEKETTSVNRLEILLKNAIDLLEHAGYEDWELQQELGLTDEEFEKYAREFYPEEEE